MLNLWHTSDAARAFYPLGSCGSHNHDDSVAKNQRWLGYRFQTTAYTSFMLDTQRLLTFATVVRVGSFAAAARELGYTQPGVSQQMKALERDLRATLFSRQGRGLKLSEEGEVLASRVESLISELRATEERISAVTRLKEGRVRVCAFPSANATLVPAAISHLRARHLGIEIELFEAEPPESLEGLERGDYDIVVAFRYNDQPTSASGEGRFTVSLLDEPMVLMMPEDHPLARRKQVSLTEFADARWIAGCVRCRQEFVNACDEAGFTPRIDITTDDNLAVQSYVVAGLGLAMMPRMTQSFVKHARIRTKPLLPERFRHVTASVLEGRQNSGAVIRVMESLKEAARELTALDI
ncbi:LysR family transcriptional regulator [Microbacterium keratanolyticum]|uniref:LysR family transcriptional regulator n=1 Tax=Microbacterium keratanolyticum TaxID=67574 RepID=UPI00362A4115